MKRHDYLLIHSHTQLRHEEQLLWRADTMSDAPIIAYDGA